MREVATPLSVPCLLRDSFQGKVDDSDRVSEGERSALQAVRSKLIGRSKWSQPFTTTEKHDHLPFSIGETARDLRRRKLSRLPVEPVQIVIPNYESSGELEMCLRSIAEHTPTPYHVLIVDNGSSEIGRASCRERV